MSLTNFHLFFIMISIVTAFGFGLWCLLTEPGRSTAGSGVMGAASLIVAVALVVYAIRFIRKLDRGGLD